MKKVILLLCAAISISVCCSCKDQGNNDVGSKISQPTTVPIYSLMPADILTSDNLNSIITYSPVCDTLKSEESEKSILYRSEPIGAGDTVMVEVYQYTDSVSKETVKAKYDADKAARSSAEDIQLEEGYEGFIAFPKVSVYHDGYYVTITAGSGSDDAQKQLLTSTAGMAVENLKTLIGSSAQAQPEDNSKSDKADKPKQTLEVISGD